MDDDLKNILNIKNIRGDQFKSMKSTRDLGSDINQIGEFFKF